MFQTLTNMSRVTGSFNIDCMFAFVKKQKLKRKIFNAFQKAQKEKNYEMINILGERYLKIK